jgi:hypothetical protein
VIVHDTLLSDIDTSITVWYIFYCVSNAFLVGASVIVVGLPALTAAQVLSPKWGALAAVCGALLAFLGLSGVSDSFIRARNDLQIAKYHFYTDKDRDKLIAAYERDKALAAYVPKAPSATEPGKTEPGKTEPGKTEPGKTEPGKTEPGKTEPGQQQSQPTDVQPTNKGP